MSRRNDDGVGTTGASTSRTATSTAGATPSGGDAGGTASHPSDSPHRPPSEDAHTRASWAATLHWSPCASRPRARSRDYDDYSDDESTEYGAGGLGYNRENPARMADEDSEYGGYRDRWDDSGYRPYLRGRDTDYRPYRGGDDYRDYSGYRRWGTYDSDYRPSRTRYDNSHREGYGYLGRGCCYRHHAPDLEYLNSYDTYRRQIYGDDIRAQRRDDSSPAGRGADDMNPTSDNVNPRKLVEGLSQHSTQASRLAFSPEPDYKGRYNDARQARRLAEQQRRVAEVQRRDAEDRLSTAEVERRRMEDRLEDAERELKVWKDKVLASEDCLDITKVVRQELERPRF
ncbi:hypothetical protein Q8F55_004935 [Vanrija albida]|uniref:Uncharacterized protein n=1 Tax=Vanrija albida TaxID=181172 RepID=A0ABR3Q0J3_9TREE